MIQYHDTLNPKLWENNSLKPDIKAKLLEIYQVFISKLRENEIPIDVIDVLLFLRQREIIHFNRFKELYEEYVKKGYK